MVTITDRIQQLYIAYFNRPADSTGLAYWEGAMGSGGTLDDISAAFARSDEYKMAFLQMNPSEVIGQIYQNLFGRQPEAAGRTYWSGLLEKGSLRIDAIVRNVAEGARHTDKASFDAKVKFAQGFTSALDTPQELAAYAGASAAQAAKSLVATLRTEADASAAEQALRDIQR